MSNQHGDAHRASGIRVSRFVLSPSTRACFDASGAVLLNLQCNRFYGLGQANARDLVCLLHEGCAADREPANISQLLAAGLLTRLCPDAPLPLPPASYLDAPLTCVGAAVNGPRPSIVTLGRFAIACSWAQWHLKYRSLDVAAQHLRALRQRRIGRAVSDWRVITQLVSHFAWLRQHTFSARDRCLFHALALTHFMLHHAVPACWVIGVRLRPWKAHSWAQLGPAVLDSTPEHVQEFLPILVS